MFTEIFEALMMLAFGAAWPASIVKSFRSRTSGGKSLQFMLIINFGYVCGIISKFTANAVSYVVALYFLNFLMVSVDTILYFRNKRLDDLRTCETARRL